MFHIALTKGKQRLESEFLGLKGSLNSLLMGKVSLENGSNLPKITDHGSNNLDCRV